MVGERYRGAKPGDKYGKLTVVSYAKSVKGQRVWNCLCDCGGTALVSSRSLVSANTRSCGCIKRISTLENRKKAVEKRTLPLGHASRNKLFDCYKRDANGKGVEFLLTLEEFSQITQQPCDYCGSPPVHPYRYGRNNGPYIANGVDRVNSSKGYCVKNVVPCCKVCNYMKNTLSVEDFIRHVHKISEFRRNKNV